MLALFFALQLLLRNKKIRNEFFIDDPSLPEFFIPANLDSGTVVGLFNIY
jgi:hypothetical protein